MMKYDKELNRIIFLVILTIIAPIFLIARMSQYQIFDRGKYLERAKDQYNSITELPPSRGTICDRQQNYLAVNRPVTSIGIDLNKVTNPEETAAKIADVLDRSRDYYYGLLTSGKNFAFLKRRSDKATLQRLKGSGVEGIREIPETMRVYPQRMATAHLVGFSDLDSRGLSGVELAKNSTLMGRPGYAFHVKDAKGSILTDLTNSIQQPEDGKNIMLTIDNTYQQFAMEELRFTINHFSAHSGIIIVTNPQTGELLALSIMPTFDPNQAGKFKIEAWRNRAITDAYEHGSTFKPIFMSAVLEEAIKKPDDIVFCENGKYKIYGEEIEDVHGYGWLTLRKIIAKSSNIGMSKIANEVKKDIIYRNCRDFGIGVKTGIELKGEVAGQLKNPVDWSNFTPMAFSMGYEVSATPLQMAMAYGVFANGGKLLKPLIYLGEYEGQAARPAHVEPVVIREFLSDSTRKTITSMLEEVVVDGTGKRAAIPGVRIAGKTGTCRKYNVEQQSYSSNEFMASFIGFFPVEDPQVLIYVMIDNPKDEYYGGIVAASTFKRLAQRIIRKMEIDSRAGFSPPKYAAQESGIQQEEQDDKMIRVPDLISKKADVGQKIVEENRLRIEFENDGDIIADQSPVPGTSVPQSAVVSVKMKKIDDSKGKYTTVPKVIGMTIREALNCLALENLHVIVQGSGRVVAQKPAAGSKIRVGAQCVIECAPLVDLADFRSW
jgi:cell division protein FtsI/penicillin-binding protein 2